MEWKSTWRGVKPYPGTDTLYNIDPQRCLLSGDSDQPKENSHYHFNINRVKRKKTLASSYFKKIKNRSLIRHILILNYLK
jgi:hypothetical protein